MPPPPPPPPVAGARVAPRYQEQNAKAVVLRKPLWEDMFPVHAASQAGRLDMLCALLPERRDRRLPTRGRDALVNRQDEDTWTASHYACYYGHAVVLEELLAQGADPAAVNLNGCGLLQFAAGQGHLCCALLLLDAGADARHEDEDRNTPASLARQLRPQGWQTLEILCLLCRSFLPIVQFSPLVVKGFRPRSRQLLTVQPAWPVHMQRMWAATPRPCETTPEPEPLPAPQPEPAPASVALLLARPVRELKERLVTAGVSCSGVVDKLDLARLVATAEADFAVNEGVPPI